MLLSRRSLMLALAGGSLCSSFGSRLGAGAAAAEQVERIETRGGSLQVEIESDGFDLSRAAIVQWVTQATRAVSSYLGQFPVPRAVVLVSMSEGADGVGHGASFGAPDAWCRVELGQHAAQRHLDHDWVLTHELMHFAFPCVPRRSHWIEEGLSTYAEPVARARVGLISPHDVWAGMVRNMPQGLPGPSDRGLDQTPTWGRTYWGGAMFCLLADVGIRKATDNRLGLPDALRAINAAGGNITTEWPIERAFEIADGVTGFPVLDTLYQQMRNRPDPIDLPALWSQLGVVSRGGRVSLDDDAPLASVREAILPAHPVRR